MRGLAFALGVSLLLPSCAPAPLPPAAPPAPPPPPPTQAPAPAPGPPPAPTQRFAEPASAEAFADPARATKLASAFGAIDAMVAAELASQDLPGVALGVVVDGALAHAAFAGARDLESKAPVDADTVFRIGSITKTFTMTALLALRDEWKVALDDAAAKHLPELAGVVYGARDEAPITLRQMLTHTSGLPRLGGFDYTRPDRDVTEEEMLRPLAGMPLHHAPGEAYEYSNLAFGLLGVVVSRAAGAPYREVVARRITGPLGMTSAAWDAASVPAGRLATGYAKRGGKRERPTLWRLGASEGAGGLFLSLRDLATWAAFQLDAWPPRSAADDGPLRRASRRESHAMARPFSLHVGARPDALRGEPTVDARSEAVGLAWHGVATCEEDAIVAHGGAIDGYRSHVYVLPKRGVAIVALANDVDANLERIAGKALAALRKTGGLSARAAEPRAPHALADAVAALARVQNAWDEPAYLAMITAGHHAKVPTEVERAELAEYQRRHGRCDLGPAVEAGPMRGRFALRCERGRFELSVSIDAEGKIDGFTGLSWGVPPPGDVARAAEGLTSLTQRWSDAIYRRLLAPKFKKPKPDLEKLFAGLRDRHGRCGPPEPWQSEGTDTHRFRLACERGGDVQMSVTLAKGEKEHVVGLFFEPTEERACPVK